MADKGIVFHLFLNILEDIESDIEDQEEEEEESPKKGSNKEEEEEDNDNEENEDKAEQDEEEGEEDEEDRDQEEEDEEETSKKKKGKARKDAPEKDKKVKGINIPGKMNIIDENDENAKNPGPILTDSEYYQNLSNISTVTSISRDIDELANHLSHVFRSFSPESTKRLNDSGLYKFYPDPRNLNYSPEPRLTSSTNPMNMAMTGEFMHSCTKNVTEKGVQVDAPFTNPNMQNFGVQTTPLHRHQHSLEAIRAVEEYKRRQEEKRRSTKLEDTIRASEFTDRYSQQKYSSTEPSFYRHQNQSPTLQSTSRPVNQDQLINNYYNSIARKSTQEPLEVKSVHDLYKNRPKHGKKSHFIPNYKCMLSLEGDHQKDIGPKLAILIQVV
jgi:Cobalamin biosynthesis protein CobT (nicotinate-mononucleotide:5, 6-dimethylbenzimidazole phosphoribosyltransferase)